MADSEEVHELFRSEKDFEELVHEMDHEQSMHELIPAVEDIGKEVAEEMGEDAPLEIDYLSLGWMRVAWEAHKEYPMNGATLF